MVSPLVSGSVSGFAERRSELEKLDLEKQKLGIQREQVGVQKLQIRQAGLKAFIEENKPLIENTLAGIKGVIESATDREAAIPALKRMRDGLMGSIDTINKAARQQFGRDAFSPADLQ